MGDVVYGFANEASVLLEIEFMGHDLGFQRSDLAHSIAEYLVDLLRITNLIGVTEATRQNRPRADSAL